MVQIVPSCISSANYVLKLPHKDYKLSNSKLATKNNEKFVKDWKDVHFIYLR